MDKAVDQKTRYRMRSNDNPEMLKTISSRNAPPKIINEIPCGNQRRPIKQNGGHVCQNNVNLMQRAIVRPPSIKGRKDSIQGDSIDEKENINMESQESIRILNLRRLSKQALL